MTLPGLLGKEGEDRAAAYLTSRGYKIEARNFRTLFGEIDIVARDKNTLVFIEVKTRSDRSYGLPEDAITARKLQRLLKACAYFNLVHHTENEPQRIDVLALENSSLRHLQNITADLSVSDLRY